MNELQTKGGHVYNSPFEDPRTGRKKTPSHWNGERERGSTRLRSFAYTSPDWLRFGFDSGKRTFKSESNPIFVGLGYVREG